MASSNDPTSPSISPNGPRPLSPNVGSLPSPRQSLSEHRQSVSELRGVPPSPRTQRHPSLTQAALQELLDHPPLSHKGQNAFAGRDWKRVKVGEVVDSAEVRWAEIGTSVEEATKVMHTGLVNFVHVTLHRLLTTRQSLLLGAPNVVLIRDSKDSRLAIGTFDYSDLNFYLLVVVGLVSPHKDYANEYADIAGKALKQQPVSLAQVKALKHNDALVALPHTADLATAVPIFASGIHRILITHEGSDEVLGILTQLRLVRFFWENHRDFGEVAQLYTNTLQALKFGALHVVSIK